MKAYLCNVALGILLGVLGGCFLGGVQPHARDLDGKYADSPLKPWFDKLASQKGLCCSFADGFTVTDADWETKDGHYRVRIPKEVNSTELVWIDVPDEAVITEPNKFGRTMVWPTYWGGEPAIRCFMPGALI